MYLQLVRESFTSKSTEGKLFINGTFEMFTLEDKDRFLEEGINQKVYGETAIPRGIYNVVYTYSPRFKVMMPLLENVEQFDGVRIHWGNKPEDTEACILVGESNAKNDDDWISNSRDAYNRLVTMIESIKSDEEITIEIV